MLDIDFLFGMPKEGLKVPEGRKCGRCGVTDQNGKIIKPRGEFRKPRTVLTDKMKRSARSTAVHLLKQGHPVRVIYRRLIEAGELTDEKGNHPGYNSVCTWLRWVKMDEKIPDTPPIYKRVEELEKQGMGTAEVAKQLKITPLMVRRARTRIRKHLRGDFKKNLTQTQKTG